MLLSTKSTISIWVLYAMASLSSVSAFNAPLSKRTKLNTLMMLSSNELEADNLSRRKWMQKIVSSSAAMSLPFMANINSASASVFTDPDRYGDKELKIATVNKIRQNVRNAINNDPDLAALFVKIAIQDALTYNPKTQEGGPDGSIVSAILNSNIESIKGLSKAAEALNDIAKSIKRTTEITMADVVAFAGAEAIESVGGPRVVLQLGKMDPKTPQTSTNNNLAYPDLCGTSNGEQVVSAFLNTGLTEREVALLYGAIGSMEYTALDALAKKKEEEEDDESNEMGDVAVFIPSSFGAPNEIYGKQLGVMDIKVFKNVLADIKKGKKPVADVFTNEKVLQWAKKYADNKNGFVKDLPEAYGKLMALGQRYTGGKVGSLLGQGDSDL